MHLNHLDLQVHDVQSTAAFFERHFGFRLQTSRTSPAIAILEGDGPFVLVLQRRKDETPYPNDFHLGFLVPDVATVERMHAALVAEHADVSAIDVNARGTMIYCRHDGFLVEVSCRSKRAHPT